MKRESRCTPAAHRLIANQKPGYFKDEIRPKLKFTRRGTVAMANLGPDLNDSRFFITLADAPHLDARYPYLDQVVEGMNIADRLLPGDEIVDATVEAPGGP